MVSTWYALEKIFREDGVEIGACSGERTHVLCLADDKSSSDLQSSYYVGDAAGRSGDHNVTDRLYALNVGIAFHAPEVQSANAPLLA